MAESNQELTSMMYDPEHRQVELDDMNNEAMNGFMFWVSMMVFGVGLIMIAMLE